MRMACLATLLAGTLLMPAPALVGRQPGPDQRDVARQLLAEDVGARRAAFDAARTIGAEAAGPELRAALIALLQRENRLVADVTRRGEIVAEYEDPEFIAALARLVAELKDPAAIPALSEAVDGGLPVVRALAGFGELALPAVLKVATAAEGHYTVVDHALLTLRFIVDAGRSRPLSARAREAIGRVARRHLTERSYFTTLWRAIDLAAALEDPELMAIVSTLAQEPKEVVARGVTDPDLVARTQQLARDRLAGLPPLPRQ
jgi:hypothetical protein